MTVSVTEHMEVAMGIACKIGGSVRNGFGGLGVVVSAVFRKARARIKLQVLI